MKIFTYFVWAFLTIYPLGCQACSSKIEECEINDGINRVEFVRNMEFDRERVRIIKEDFSEDQCITLPEKILEVNEKFERLVDYFYYDMELKRYYTGFLLYQGKGEETLKVFAQMLESSFLARDESKGLAENFMWLLAKTRINGRSLQKCIDKLNNWVQPSVPIQQMSCGLGIRSLSSDAGVREFNHRAAHNFKENAIFLLGSLAELQPPIIYNAALNILIGTLDGMDQQDTANILVTELYKKNGEQSSPRLKELYAHRILMVKKQYLDAIPLYESILSSRLNHDNPYSLEDLENPDQTSINYNALSCCYFVTQVKLTKSADDVTNYEYSDNGRVLLNRGVTLLETALYLKPLDLMTSKNLAILQFALGQYESAIENIENLINKADQELAVFNIKRRRLQKKYELILQKSGRTEGVTSILRQKQEKIMQKNQKIGNLIKEAQKQHQKEMKEARHKEQKRQEELQANGQ